LTVGSTPRYRVVQWATGNIGTRALREVIRHPGLELVGLLVYDAAKDGADAGTLCGEQPVGVKATTSRAAIHSLDADCVLYMPRALDLDDVVAFLEAGTNVVTTCGMFFDEGRRLGDEQRARVLDACARGRASVFDTGSSPGFITEILPFALLSLQRHVESIAIEEFANMSQRNSPHMIFELMGFGRSPDRFNAKGREAHLLQSFSPSLGALAAAAGRPVDAWSSTGEYAVAKRTVRIAAGELKSGTIAAMRTRIVGRSGGDEVVSLTPTWYCSTELEPAWDLGPTGWRLRVRGDAPLRVELPIDVPLEELGAHTPSLTANPPVNAIAYVCAAPPGILSTADLPPITPAGPRAGQHHRGEVQ
jgi:4-hydroxy-tetrahydrodipicolinate reductase